MNEQNQSSFIPKNPVRGSSRPRPVKRVYLISIVASVLFVATVLAAGGLFIYTIALERELASEQQRLNDQRDSFNQGNLEQVLEFEARLNAADQILSQQVYLPALFEALEETALTSTVYTGFAFEKNALNNIVVTLDTTNPSFDGVIFQREVLASNEILQGATITDITYSTGDSEGATNQVSFVIEHSPRGSLLQANRPPAPAASTAPATGQTVPSEAATTEILDEDVPFDPEADFNEFTF